MSSPSPQCSPPSIGLLLRQVRDGFARHLDAAVKDELPELGFTHLLGLKVLAERSPCTANELAHALEQTPSAITRLLDRLEALGAVKREPHALDRRALQIVMTEQGHALLQRLMRHGDRVMQFALRDLSPAESAQLTQLLTRVRDSLNSP